MTAKKTYVRRTKAENEQLKDYAKILITKEGYTQVAACLKTGVSKTTMSKWYTEGKWDKLEKKLIHTRQETLARRWAEIEEFDASILAKPEGERFASSKEADARRKIMADIKELEIEAAVTEIISVCTGLLEFTRKANLEDAQKLEKYADSYIKSKL